ncbi:hypothetical protein [Brevundimonas sp. NIBR11]|uniref:hypothetical protein n=1 Tax=Brevundimonas sp. NIBR11 TaxID=3015999 RepID=UPI0022F0035F|nr:hypothetical protein [Brevundimonas sp. NIBR11]WGM32579.1 hypothetical protein KKHFBJBL_02833 [Brevundimonas sp. NIBR11]
MWDGVAVVVIVGVVGLFFATFWIKNEEFWKPIHRGFVWIMVVGFILTVLYYCTQSEGRSGDGYDEPTYRGRR